MSKANLLCRKAIASGARAGFAALILVLAGCTTSPSSSSVQAGGTIAIALLDGEFPNNPNLIGTYSPIGYGGSFNNDRQRGAFLFRTIPGGYDLETLYAYHGTPAARAAETTDILVVVVKVPSTVPEGLYDLELLHVAPGATPAQATPVSPPYTGSLTVLPATINVGGIDVSGDEPPSFFLPTTTQVAELSLGNPDLTGIFTGVAGNIMPHPGIRFWPVRDGTQPGRVLSSYSVTAIFDQGSALGAIGLEASPDDPHFDAVWTEADPNDPTRVTIHVVSLIEGRDAGDAWVTFSLDAAATQPVDIADVQLVLDGAADERGDASLLTDAGIVLADTGEIR